MAVNSISLHVSRYRTDKCSLCSCVLIILYRYSQTFPSHTLLPKAEKEANWIFMTFLFHSGYRRKLNLPPGSLKPRQICILGRRGVELSGSWFLRVFNHGRHTADRSSSLPPKPRAVFRAMSVLLPGHVRFPFSSTSSAWRTYGVAKSTPGATHTCLTPQYRFPQFPRP